MYKVKSVEDLESVYSILREQCPDKQIDITFNWNTKEYFIKKTDKLYKHDPEVPLDLNIEVVYGDSVTGDTPILLRNPKNNEIIIKTIESICNQEDNKNIEWIEYPEFKLFDKSVRLEKMYALTDLEVWSDKGWNPIKKIIRHKTNKKIYRVMTDNGCVDVTEDHSLCNTKLEKIKPREAKAGIELLHSFPDNFPENKETLIKINKQSEEKYECKDCGISKGLEHYYKNIKMKNGHLSICKQCIYYKNSTHQVRKITNNCEIKDYTLTEMEAKCWGYFYKSGFCESYTCNSGIKHCWSITNNDFDEMNYFKNLFEKIEPIEFKISKLSNGTYKLAPVGSVKYMCNKYIKLFYENEKYKIVPNCILNTSKTIKTEFLEGAKNKNNFIAKGKIGTMGIYYLLKSIRTTDSIKINNDSSKPETYIIELSNEQNNANISNIVKKITKKKSTSLEGDFVYDIETELGRFQAGIGQLICYNTDSIFIKYKYNIDDFESNRKNTFKLATLAGDKLTNEIFNRHPIEMEFEKVFQPFILLTKKRYIGKKFENPKDPFQLKTIDSKGIALTRRDYCKLVKDCYKSIIDVIMDGKNDSLDKSIDVFKQFCDKIDNYEAKDEDLCISAMLAKEYSCGLCKKKTEWSGIRCECKHMNSHLEEYCGKCKSTITCKHVFSLAHVNLAVNLLKRKEDVQVNERVQYMFIEGSDPRQKKGELAEDPVWAKRLGLKFNRLCYLEQLAKPILGLYKVLLQDQSSKLDDLIDWVNYRIEKYGGKKLKPSDFKLEE